MLKSPVSLGVRWTQHITTKTIPGAFQVKKIRRKLRKRKGDVERRLDEARKRKDSGNPVFSQRCVSYDLGQRVEAIRHGGIGLAHQVSVGSGLVEAIDESVEVLECHRPYHESDHVLNIAYNALCGGQRLEDIETRRQDEVFLDALGVEAIPDPTTAGDFCRRFSSVDIERLMEAINEARLKVWDTQDDDWTDQTARIEGDGSIVETFGECKGGMGLSYNGKWGYHPLLISLANTNEPLFLCNRSGNRSSSEGAAGYFDRAIELCRRGGFSEILLRGDTDFAQTRHLDRWDADGVGFVFGYKGYANMTETADGLEETAEWTELERRADQQFEPCERRAKQPRIKEQIVQRNGYENIRLDSEDVAEFGYSPTACEKTYRVVVVRKNLTVLEGKQALFDDIRYFFYITNDWEMTCGEVVAEANERCDQENLVDQLKNGVRALHAPVNTLNANWAYMVMASLAWTLKAWMALSLPICGRWRQKHQAERKRWLTMEFRSFLERVINVPAQIVKTGRRLVYRFLAWRPQMPVVFRLVNALPGTRAST